MRRIQVHSMHEQVQVAPLALCRCGRRWPCWLLNKLIARAVAALDKL